MLTHVDCTLAIFSIEFLRSMHSTATFLNAGTQRLRMLVCTRKVVELITDIEHGEPDPVDQAYGNELRAFLTKWADITSVSRRTKKNGLRGAVRRMLTYGWH